MDPYTSHAMKAMLLPLTLLLLAWAPAQAGIPPSIDVAALAPGRTSVVPGEAYAAGWPHRVLFGSSYRALWAMPVEAPLLNVQAFAGGLTPTGTGGGKQTLSLRFTGADGRPYTFRALDKDPSDTLPETLQNSFIAGLFQDQISSSLPTAHVVAPPLLEALGILHVTPQLSVLPDDPALGEYREQFAGKIGMIEEFPMAPRKDGGIFQGMQRVISSDDLFERLDEDPAETIAVEEFLMCRLVDVLIGDWDRHRGQWRWGGSEAEGPDVWRPIPEDRDQAFSRYDGLALTAARNPAPQLTKFGPAYPGLLGALWNGRDLDRRFLVQVAPEDWRRVAVHMQTVLNDSLLDSAVRRLPREHHDAIGGFLLEALRQRRDDLPDMAWDYYRHINQAVDLHGTDEADRVVVERLGDGQTRVRASWPGLSEGAFERTFEDRHTRDLRLHLRGGDDRVEFRGNGDPETVVRVLATAGADTVLESSRHPDLTRVYDERPKREAVTASGVRVNRKPYRAPDTRPGELPPPDRGTKLETRLVTGYSPDFGFVLGGGIVQRKFGFRRHPVERKTRLLAAGATGKHTGRFLFRTETHPENSRNQGTFEVLVSGLENPNFFGLGNETPRTEDASFYRLEQTLVQVRPSGSLSVAPGFDLLLGAAFRWYETDLDSTRFIGQEQPYGSEPFAMLSAEAGLSLDLRDRPGAPRRGLHVTLLGEYAPDVLDLPRGDFTALEGEAAVYWTPVARLTLAGRGGGRTVWGDPPFQEAALLGGPNSLRGYPADRFAGSGAAYGSLEARVELGDVFLLLPSTFGFLLLSDVGRVWLDGEDSQRWHNSFGAGLWVAPISAENATILGLAKSPEETRLYFGLGFGF